MERDEDGGGRGKQKWEFLRRITMSPGSFEGLQGLAKEAKGRPKPLFSLQRDRLFSEFVCISIDKRPSEGG